jgi:methylmalonyl-CoA mutase
MEKNKKPDGLFSEFPPVSTEQWEAKIQVDLKGADYEKKLIWKTAEGFKVKPYYRSEDIEGFKEMLSNVPGEFPFTRGTVSESNDWLIGQDIEFSNPKKANAFAKEALDRGADAIVLNASEIKSVDSLKEMLKGLDFNRAMLCFNSAPSYSELLKVLSSLLRDTGFESKSFKGSFDFDPLSYFLINGHFYTGENEDMMEGVELLKNTKEFDGLKVLSVNGQHFHNSGSTLVQELAFSLASGNEYLTWYTQNGLSSDEVAQKIVFNFAIGGNYFMEIAKLRAARMLWAKIVENHNPAMADLAKMFIHSTTANWNKTIYDSYVNMLRTTTEAMSAAIGRADVITVLPFDMSYQEPDEFSLRIARNQQIILKEETNLDKVIDPSAGSYYIENLTASIADAAWKLFLQVEEMGGMLQAIKSGFVQSQITEEASKKKSDVANRRTLILGTNQHPNLNENMLAKIQMEEEQSDEEIVEFTPKDDDMFKTLELSRASDEFEDLRLATEIWENEGNKRPSVFLLTIGNLAMRKARAGFSSGFFGVAGYTIIDNPGFATAQEGVDAAIASEAEIIVVCSSDEEYAELVPTIAADIKKVDSDKQIVVAGFPKEIVDSLKASGVDEFIHVKSNALDTMYKFQQKLRVML